MNDAKRFYEQIKEEREKQRLSKEVSMTERELELNAQEEDPESLENADDPTKGVAIQKAEKLVARITQEHARLAAAQQNPEFTVKDKDDYKNKNNWKHLKNGTASGGCLGCFIPFAVCVLWDRLDLYWLVTSPIFLTIGLVAGFIVGLLRTQHLRKKLQKTD